MTRLLRRNAPQFELNLTPRAFQPVTVVQPAMMSLCAAAGWVDVDADGITDDSDDQDPTNGGGAPASSAAALLRGGRRSRWAFSATKILDHLYLGSYTDAMHPDELAQMGIRRILNVAGECPVERAVSEQFKTKHVELRDHSDEDIAAVFADCIRFIREGVEQGERVLVHCRMGVSRSTTIVLAYLMRYGTKETEPEEISYSSAFDFVKSLRPEVSPNLGFVLALRDLDRQRGFEAEEGTFEYDGSLPLSSVTSS